MPYEVRKQSGTSEGTGRTCSSVLVVVVVVRVVGDVGSDERSGGGAGGACWPADLLVGRKQQKRLANSRELFCFRVTTAAHRNNKQNSDPVQVKPQP